MRLFELPPKLCPAGKPAIAALVERPDGLTVSHQIYLAQNDDASSYAFLGGSSHFAQRGRLLADYPETNTIDTTRGVRVVLLGPDREIAEQTLFGALSNKLLVFIGDEILSVSEAQLVAVDTFLLKFVRGRFGTVRAAHTEGDDIYLIPFDWLMPLQHDFLTPGNTVVAKITAAAPDLREELQDVDPIELTLTGRMMSLPAPSLLKVNGTTRFAYFDQVSPIAIDWVLPDAFGIDLSQAYTQLEFIEGVDVIHTERVAWPGRSLSFTYPPVVPASFTLSATIIIDNGWEVISGESTTISVNATGAT